MNLIISFLYAPLVFYTLKNYELKIVSICILTFSLVWFISIINQTKKELIFPTFYILISFLAYYLDSFLVLKILPLLISVLISIFMFYSYFSKKSFIFTFLAKMNKEVDEKEKLYIQKSTLFWSFASLINIILHIFVLTHEDISYWLYYSSFGWYLVFIITGIIQFIHKEFLAKEINE